MTGHWFVVTAPATQHERILEDGSGPTYHDPAVLIARARSAAAARVLAVRVWRRMFRRRPHHDNVPDALKYSENPFAGVRCVPLEP